MANRVKSDLQKEYQKERRRLLQAVRRAEAQGFIFPEDIVPKMPKHVTKKAVQSIKRVTPSDIRSRGTFFYTETDTITSETQRKIATAQAKVTPTKAKKIPPITHKPISFSIPHVKPKLTEEQKHEINVKRGKKAWETRRSKMTDEQYTEFVEQFKRNVAKGRKPKVQPPEITVETPTPTSTEPIVTETNETPYYPTITAVDSVRDKIINVEISYGETLWDVKEKISDLKRVARPQIPIENRKGYLLQIFDNMVAEYGDNIGEYEDYLIQHMDEIDSNLDAIRYYESGRKDRSATDVIESSFGALARILNQGSLSPWQAEAMSNMAEFSNDFGV